MRWEAPRCERVCRVSVGTCKRSKTLCSINGRVKNLQYTDQLCNENDCAHIHTHTHTHTQLTHHFVEERQRGLVTGSLSRLGKVNTKDKT